jgi:hypothetical protein
VRRLVICKARVAPRLHARRCAVVVNPAAVTGGLTSSGVLVPLEWCGMGWIKTASLGEPFHANHVLTKNPVNDGCLTSSLARPRSP